MAIILLVKTFHYLEDLFSLHWHKTSFSKQRYENRDLNNCNGETKRSFVCFGREAPAVT